jgi:endonuclease V-like protein UPF0215 family
MAEWTSEAVEKLKELYVETDIPSDSLIKKKDDLEKFTSALNSRLPDDEDFTSEEVATELLRVRKSGSLPPIRT